MEPIHCKEDKTMLRGENKITASHRSRACLVYVRQSTMAQVRGNTESTARQYGLASEATRLGWAASDIEVIDTDLGLSGRSADNRLGFKEIVARVCLGEVGAIFGLEVSRLARSNADLAKLLELARLTDTLVIDTDGVYDLADYSDRLILGFKSQMSEAELHILSSRLQGAKHAAAQRGELRSPLPVGYVYDEEAATVMDPDQEVQAAIRDVFAAFDGTGSAYGVVGAFGERKFPQRAYGGAWAGELRWGRLTYSRACRVLSNPAYAGAYVYGRFRSRRVVNPDGTTRLRTTELPRSEWPVLIVDHHEGYISWEQFLTIEAKLAANRTTTGARPPREGGAICQGIILCGGCGRAMSTYSAGGHDYYDCAHARQDHTALSSCRSVRADTVDAAVSDCLLGAVCGEELTLALAAADEVTQRRARSTRAAELAVERAKYQADRAERALLAVEPENRLVARSFENRLEGRLAELAEAEAALVTQRAATVPLPPRAELEAVVTNLGELWAAPTTSNRDRKRLLRTLVADVTLIPDVDRAKLRIGIHWRSGATEELVAQRMSRVHEIRRTAPEAIELARQIGPDLDNHELAAALNAAGYQTGAGRSFDSDAVSSLRHYHGIGSPALLQPGELTVRDVAARLGVNHGAVINWINRGVLTARRGLYNRWCIPFDPEVEARWRDHVATSPHVHTDIDPSPLRPTERTVAEVAVALGINPDAVYHWTVVGHVPWRRGPSGRKYIDFTPELQLACRQRITNSAHLSSEIKSKAQHALTGGKV
jgi:DNA invertase Pin-like site-specific DNA recombinase